MGYPGIDVDPVEELQRFSALYERRRQGHKGRYHSVNGALLGETASGHDDVHNDRDGLKRTEDSGSGVTNLIWYGTDCLGAKA